MSLLEGLTSHFDIFGIRGVLAISSHRLIGHPREITAQPEGIRSPIHIRLRTSDAGIYRQVILHKEYAFDLPFTPRTIVDAGANIGTVSIYYAHQYTGARIISVEAEASNFEALCKNVAPYPNVVPIHAALWKRDGFVSVSQPDSAGEWGFVTHEGSGDKVRAVTMRTLMREANVPFIDLLKIDIEGSEKEIFEDCDRIGNVKAIAIELHDRFKPGCSKAVNAVTSDFRKFERGETTFYVRH
jgi:FkbM family methyltransferase